MRLSLCRQAQLYIHRINSWLIDCPSEWLINFFCYGRKSTSNVGDFWNRFSFIFRPILAFFFKRKSGKTINISQKFNNIHTTLLHLSGLEPLNLFNMSHSPRLFSSIDAPYVVLAYTGTYPALFSPTVPVPGTPVTKYFHINGYLNCPLNRLLFP